MIVMILEVCGIVYALIVKHLVLFMNLIMFFRLLEEDSRPGVLK